MLKTWQRTICHQGRAQMLPRTKGNYVYHFLPINFEILKYQMYSLWMIFYVMNKYRGQLTEFRSQGWF